MKTKIKFIAVFFILFLSISILPQKTSAQNVSVNFQVFYDELSPYGTWIYNNIYGYVWIPNVDKGFTPYATNGYWILTDEGWTWVSNYPWGWAPFHYGRWYTDDTYGPIWVPDNEWGPGWVTWRRSSDYYGWAPMSPGISISIAYDSGYNEHFNRYTFVRSSHFGKRNINNYYINTTNNITIINNTTVINNTRINKSRNITYNAGPDRNEVEKRVGKSFTPVKIKESNKPGENLNKNQLQIYRPQVQKNNSLRQKSAPKKVGNLNSIKTPIQIKPEIQNQRPNTQKQQQNVQPYNKQQSEPQRNVQPVKQQKPQPQRSVQPIKQPQPQRNVQPSKQQQSQPKRTSQPTKKQQTKSVPNVKEK